MEPIITQLLPSDPFDHPHHGGYFTLEKVTNKTPQVWVTRKTLDYFQLPGVQAPYLHGIPRFFSLWCITTPPPPDGLHLYGGNTALKCTPGCGRWSAAASQGEDWDLDLWRFWFSYGYQGLSHLNSLELGMFLLIPPLTCIIGNPYESWGPIWTHYGNNGSWSTRPRAADICDENPKKPAGHYLQNGALSFLGWW